jgi:H+/Cl- antiporter ClcA
MNANDEFDALLKARFDAEHRQLPVETFVASVRGRMREERRMLKLLRVVMAAAALVALVLVAPWLIAGANRLDELLRGSLSWASAPPVTWVLAMVAVVVVLMSRARSR